ncbi:histidine N-acetyltransferase-like [Oculina patagonica]
MNFLQRTHASLMRHLAPKLIRSFSQKGVVQRKELTFRLAESRDFDAVVKLSEGVYNGYDNLPLVYHNWLKMDNLDIMLTHLGEKLVGLGACYIVDDEKTFVLRAGRVMPELHGRGIVRELSHVLEDHVREKFPKVSRQWLTTTSSHFFFFNQWRQVLEQDILFYDIAEQPFRAGIPSTGKEATIESCSKECFSKIILFNPATEKLLPSNVLIIDWCPYEPLRSNIDYILREHDVHFFVEKRPVGADPVSFSHGVHGRRTSTGVEWLATIYTDDPDLFEAHLLHQYKHASEVIKGKFIIVVSLQRKSEAGCARRVLGGILKLRETSHVYENETLTLRETSHVSENETMKLFEIDFN